MATRPLMRKARRAANAVANGPEILNILRLEKSRQAMKASAASGMPSVEGIGEILLESIKRADLVHLPVRQFIGQVVRAVMDEEGYEISESGVRFSDPNNLFRSGSVYEEAVDDEDSDPDWVRRVVGIMSDIEAAYASRLLEERLPT